MRILMLLLMISISFRLFSQNLIVNPDFSDVSIFFKDGKKVYPKSWKSFSWPFPSFYHPAKKESENIFAIQQTNSQDFKGIISLQILHPSEGICTKLKEPLIIGQNYDIKIKMHIKKLMLNSDAPVAKHMDGTIADSSELDYNFPVDLITYFSPIEYNGEYNNNRSFVIFDLSSCVSSDTSSWISLSKNYTAKGDEKYFAIGTGSDADYIQILRDIKNDTIDYRHKFAEYSICNVSILPHIEESNAYLKITDNCESLRIDNNEERFVFLKVNFESNSYALNDESKQELNKIAEFLKKNIDLHLHIIGHTDTVGTIKYNQTLSEKRAKEVYKYLKSQSINIARLSYEGKGELSPLDNNQRLENLGSNRRIEFEFKKSK